MALLLELLSESRSQNTSKLYLQGFKRWAKWAYSNGLGSRGILPAKALHVALYMPSIVQTTNR